MQKSCKCLLFKNSLKSQQDKHCHERGNAEDVQKKGRQMSKNVMSLKY
jgi:hypothetical protein